MNVTKGDISDALFELENSALSRLLSKKNTTFTIEESENRFDVQITTYGLVFEKEVDLLAEVIFFLRKKGFRFSENLITLTINKKIFPYIVKTGSQRIFGVKNTIAIASGKGGVGKSTVSVNLSLALSAFGLRIGLLDADIYGPSLPTMLGICDRPVLLDNKKIKPLFVNDLQVNSIGFMITKTDALIYRGPMASNALIQLFRQTNWTERDFVVIDMPPGTGDIHLTITKSIPTTASVIVTTSDEMALDDARRAAQAFYKMDVPIIGLIENMSSHVCNKCGHNEPLFGSGKALLLANELQVPFLGSIPFDGGIVAHSNKGVSLAKQFDISKNFEIYRKIAVKIVDNLHDLCLIDYSDCIPSGKSDCSS